MRFKKGSKVEVLRKEVPSGSWWCAEILCGNGHTYLVKYDKRCPDTSVPMERVLRKDLRPCPPVQAPRSWIPNDILEVFEGNSWKLAEVERVVSGNYYYVRVLGSAHAFRVHESNLRLRLSWQDGKWIVIRKDSFDSNDRNPSKGRRCRKLNYKISQMGAEVPDYVADKCSHDDKNVELVKSHISKGMKRGSQVLSPPHETFHGCKLKLRVIEKEDGHQRRVAGKSSQIPEKVDAVAYPCNMLGEKYMHASFNNRKTGFLEINMERREPNADVGCFSPRSLEPNDAESASSVGSCSGNDNYYTLQRRHITCPSVSVDRHSSDAESSCASDHGGNQSGLKMGDLEAVIHQYELNAYRATMEALHASGPISWEQEALITNLRLMLHISTDEHLIQLRQLASSESDLLS